MTIPQNSRVLYADLLRILATFVVILFHVCTDRWYGCFDEPSEWYVLNFFVAGLRWCVPMFFMLSGMNFLDPNKNISYKKLFTKYIPHILCALAFWSIFYKSLAVGTNYVLGLKPVTGEDVSRAFTAFLFEIPWFHLWFLYPLIGMYVLTPALRVFTKNASNKDYIYLLSLYFIFAWFLPVLYPMLGGRIAIGVDGLAPYVGYFIAGYFFATYDFTRTQRKVLYTIGGSLLALTVFGHIALCLDAGKSIYQPFFQYQSFNIGLVTFFLFVLVKNVVNNSDKIKAKLQDNKFITLLSNCSFGIYLSHAIFLNVIGGILHINTGSFPAIISVPVLSITVFLLSLLMTLIIKRIPVLNKWIV